MTYSSRFALALRSKALPGGLAPVSTTPRGWSPVIRESYTGAWQKNDAITLETALAYWAVFACITLIARDIAKLRLRLVEQDRDGVWQESPTATWAPVLRQPNRYQTINRFVEQWMLSKLSTGNTYVLKQRDERGVIAQLYVLNPARVEPLVAEDGSVFYRLTKDDLNGLDDESITVPARAIIHDRFNCLYHPLIGVTPIYAAGLAAAQGLNIQRNAANFFANSSTPGGILTAPGAIDEASAQRLKETFETNYGGANAGRIAVVSDGLTYQALNVNAVDSQLIEQLKWTADVVCSTFHVPMFMIDTSKTPPYANSEPLTQQYYAQCLQSLINDLEIALDTGLELPTPYGTECDIDDLIWMDTVTRTKAAGDAIGAGALSPDEARLRYFGVGPVKGGNTPYLQQQYFSLAALAERDAADPFVKPVPPASPPPEDEEESPDDELVSFLRALRKKAVA
jgi:HK97 family phage portal protein